MKSARKALSLLMSLVMVLSLVPVIGLVSANADSISVSNSSQLFAALTKSGTHTITVDKDIDEVVSVTGTYWVRTAGDKTLNLNGHRVKLTIKSTYQAYLIDVPKDASLTVYDPSAKKTGAIHCDADMTSGNEYRYRSVFINSGTLKIYGGNFDVGHYESFYSAKYVKTVYKMTTGSALINSGTCYVYGGQFVGRNGRGECMYNAGKLTVYDAYLYGKGGANGITTTAKGTTSVYAIEVDLNKESAVENEHKITSGYPIGKSGVSTGMLVGDYKITKQSDSTTQASAKLTIVPAVSGNANILDGSVNGTDSITIPVAPGQPCGEVLSISHFTKNSISIRSADNTPISYIKWHYRIQRMDSYTGQYTDITQGDINSNSYGLRVSDMWSAAMEGTNYRILFYPIYYYTGWSHSYWANPADPNRLLSITLVSGSTVVTLNPNGGTVSPTSKAVTYGSVYGSLPTPTRSGYSFDGWYTASSGGSPVTISTKVTTSSNHTLYAHWKNVSAPVFVKNLPTSTTWNENSTALNFTVEARDFGGNYIWQLYTGSNWVQLGSEDMQLVYQNGNEVTYAYTGEVKAGYKMRCVVSNTAGSTFSTTCDINPRYPFNSNEADTQGQFLLYAEDVFYVSGRGTVVSGRVTAGALNLNDTVTLRTASGDIPAKVTGIEMFGKTMSDCRAGDNVGLLLATVDSAKPVSKSVISKGDAIVNSGSTLVRNTSVTGIFEMKSAAEGGRLTPITNGYRPQAFIGTSDQTVEISAIGGSCMMPGDTQTGIRLALISGAVMYFGQKIEIREGGKTVGTFTVTNVANKDNGYIKVTFDYHGGSADPYNPVKSTGGVKEQFVKNTLPEYMFVKAGASYGTLPKPFKEGYTFSTWGTTVSGSDYVTSTSKAPSSNVTLHARYVQTGYLTLSFEKNGADKIEFVQISQENTKPYAKFPSVERAGYTLIGWKTDNGKFVSIGDEIEFKVSHTLTAVWDTALEEYPEFTKDLPEALNLFSKLHPVDSKIMHTMSVEADGAASYEWYMALGNGTFTHVTGVAVTNGGKSLDLSKLNPLIQQQLIANGGKVKVTAVSAGGQKTESKVCTLSFKEEVTPTVMKGDVDLSGEVNVQDARYALRGAIGLKDAGIDLVTKTSKNFLAANVDGDDKLTVADARLILRVAIKLDSFK